MVHPCRRTSTQNMETFKHRTQTEHLRRENVYWVRAGLNVDDYLFSIRLYLFRSISFTFDWSKSESSSSHIANASNLTRSLFGLFFRSISSFNLGSLSNSTWRVPWNRSKPCKHMPCRRLLQRRDPSISKSRTTGAAAARRPTAPSTE